MGSYQDQRTDLLNLMEKFKEQVLNKLLDTVQDKPYYDLLSDIQSDFYTIVVLGEFKRGKSTFINALLGEELLPVGVTPTTATINALMWGDNRRLSVCNKDGSVEYLDLSANSLNVFVAETDVDFDAIKYIKLELPSDMLKNKVVFVDTPGIDDLNEHRVEVTYSFIPRADAVIFLLDATSPVRQTEKEFLNDYILKNGLERIVFLANFMDQVDDEEKEEVFESANRRLAMAIDNTEKQVLPISASLALEAKLSGDTELLNESGLPEVEIIIKNIIAQGSQGQEKILRFNSRFEQILDSCNRELSTLISLQNADHSQLSQQLEKIEDLLSQGERRRQVMQDYLEDRQKEMLLILRKSINFFGDNLKEEVLLMFDDYNGADFKTYVEKNIPNNVKRRMRAWADQYSGPINTMFEMLKRELSLGLAREFNTSVNKIYSKNDSILVELETISIEAADIANSELMSGLIAGGIGTVIAIAGAPIWPILAFAGYPFIRKKFVTSQLESAKANVRPQLEQSLDKILSNFYYSIEANFLSTLNSIGNAAMDKFDELLGVLNHRIRNEVTDRQKEQASLDEKRNVFTKLMQSMESFREQLAKPNTHIA